MKNERGIDDRYHAFLVFDGQSGNLFYEKILSKLGETILSRTDPLMLGSFISAITSYSDKMTFLSDIRTIKFDEIKITFIRRKTHLFVLVSAVQEPEADLFFKIKVLASIFESEHLFDLANVEATSVIRRRDFSNFDPILMEVLGGTTRELQQNLKNALELSLRRIIRQNPSIESIILLTFTGDVIIKMDMERVSSSVKLDYSRIISLLYLKNVVDSSYLILKSRHLAIIVVRLVSGILLLIQLSKESDPHDAREKIMNQIIPELLHFFE